MFELTRLLARRPGAAHEQLGIDAPLVEDLDELLSVDPDFVVACISKSAVSGLMRQLTRRKVPVLVETPPAPDLEGLRTLWNDVGDASVIQVAEQYLRMPENAAALAVVRSGMIGTATSVNVSSTHEHHAVSMIRGLLGAGLVPATVHAHHRRGLLVDPLDPKAAAFFALKPPGRNGSS